MSYNKLQDHLSGWEPSDFGEGWQFYVCRTYHTNDAKGQRLEKPFGSFYAIRNIPPQVRQMPVKPVLIGATIPPALVNGNVREDILALFEGSDQSQIRVLSPYDAQPYSPYFNIPDLLAFSTRRLDGEYIHVQFPAGWTELAAAPPRPDELRPEFTRFLDPLVEMCRLNRPHPVVLCDFGAAELLLAYYLALCAGTRTIFLAGPGFPLDEIPPVFRELPHVRLNLQDGVEEVRAAIFAESLGPPPLRADDHPLRRGLRRIVRRLRTVG